MRSSSSRLILLCSLVPTRLSGDDHDYYKARDEAMFYRGRGTLATQASNEDGAHKGNLSLFTLPLS